MAFPKWLTCELAEKALRVGEHAEVEVSSMAMTPFDEAAGNCASTLHRVLANTTDGERFMVAKTMPATEHGQMLALEGRMFHREAIMYGAVIPDLEEMLAAQLDNKGEPLLATPFAATHIYNGRHPQKYILLEDLSRDGFRMADRHEGLDLPHSLLALRSLAVFHGVSAAYLNSEPIVIHKLGNPYAFLESHVQHTVQHMFRCLANKCREWCTYKLFASPIENMVQDTSKKLAACHKHTGTKLLVISHGDFRLNNLMFRYDGDKVKEVRFLDFQMSHVTSPAADLLFFLSTSLNNEVYRTHRNTLIKEYHDTLKKTLRTFRLQSPSLEDLEEMFQANSIIAVHSTITVAPILKARLLPHQERLLREGHYEHNTVFDSDDVGEWIKFRLVELAELKWIDVPEYRAMATKSDYYSFK